MPLHARFEGVKILVFSNDHLPPHIHAEFGEFEVLVAIRDCTVLVGDFPPKKLAKVIGYVAANREALEARFFELNPRLVL